MTEKEKIAIEIAEINKQIQEILKIRKELRKIKKVLDDKLALLNQKYLKEK